MRNATQVDVIEAKRTSKLREDVMYSTGCWLVHGKRMTAGIEELRKPWIVAERDDGCLVFVFPDSIRVRDKAPSQQPKRPRRKPIPGTKRETLLPMSKDVKLEVGDKVVLADGRRFKIWSVDLEDEPAMYCPEVGVWCSSDGNANIVDKKYSITHKILPYKAPVVAEKSQAEKDFEAGNCAEEIAFHKGLWVAHVSRSAPFAFSYDGCPEWATEERVEVFLAGDSEMCSTAGRGKGWDWGNLGSGTIVAYRKAKQQ